MPEVLDAPQTINREPQHAGYSSGVCFILSTSKAGPFSRCLPLHPAFPLLTLPVGYRELIRFFAWLKQNLTSVLCQSSSLFNGRYIYGHGVVSPAMLLIFHGTGNFSRAPSSFTLHCRSLKPLWRSEGRERIWKMREWAREYISTFII